MDEPKKSPLEPDAKLESQAKAAGAYPTHPAIERMASKLGAFNLIKNARNRRQVDVTKADDPQ